MKKVCVILACYNPNEFLKEQVDSIREQTGVEADIWIFDDNSSSGHHFLSDVASYKNVRVINNAVGSGNAGKNFLRSVLAVSTDDYEFFCFSDQDDIWLPSKISAAVAMLDERDCGGYSSNLYVYEDGQVTGILDKSTLKQTIYDYQFQGGSAGNTYVMRADFVRVLQRELTRYNFLAHPGSVSHDWIVYAIARSFGIGWCFDKSSYIYYRQHSNNVYGARRSMRQRFQMLCGSWYSNGVWLVGQYTNGSAPALALEISMFSKLRHIRSALLLRRNIFESIICYFFWLFIYRSR